MSYKSPAIHFVLSVIVLSLIALIYWYSPFSLQAKRTEYLKTTRSSRVSDLLKIQKALHDYYIENQKYPLSSNYNGLISCWGASTPDWIPGLAPKYIESLPNDPRNDKDCKHQYLYISDGSHYKVIAQNVPEYYEAIGLFPELFDSKRQYSALAIWTKEWRNY
jgi:hypothetical protein